VDPHCFDADPDPDPDPGGGGGRSAKNVHPLRQNPRYAPADRPHIWSLSTFNNAENLPSIVFSNPGGAFASNEGTYGFGGRA
jgi:hypothetical protein